MGVGIRQVGGGMSRIEGGKQVVVVIVVVVAVEVVVVAVVGRRELVKKYICTVILP